MIVSLPMKEYIETKEDYFSECANIVDGESDEAKLYLQLWKKYLLRKLPFSYVFESEKWVVEKDFVALEIKALRSFKETDIN